MVSAEFEWRKPLTGRPTEPHDNRIIAELRTEASLQKLRELAKLRKDWSY